jgi:hypothetical protein
MHNLTTSKSTRQGELLTTLHRQLYRNHQGLYVFTKEIRPFFWDEATQHSFDALKNTLTTAPLLRPPNYNKDFLL